jgi:hypothetical protein
MILIKILTENGVEERPIFDSKTVHTWQASYDAGAVYLIDEYLDGKLVARDRDYEQIGVVQMTAAEFKAQVLPLVFSTAPAAGNIWAEAPADSCWLEADDDVRAAKIENSLSWAKREGS